MTQDSVTTGSERGSLVYLYNFCLPALIQGDEILKRGNLNIPENKGLLTLFTEKVRFNLVIL